MKSTQTSLRRLQAIAFFAILTFASRTVMLADLYSPGPNTTDLQGQWIDVTTSPPGGPPVYGTPGPEDDVDLQGFDITASGGSVRSIYDPGSLTVTGMASAFEASQFTLRGSGTLNVDHVTPNVGFTVVGGHLNATGAADFVDVSGGGSVTAATCRGGSFREASSLTLMTTSLEGSASFFSGSTLTATELGLDNFTLTLNSSCRAQVKTYSIENSGGAYINGPDSSLGVTTDFTLESGNFSLNSGGTATVQNILASGGEITIDGSGSALTVSQNISITRGDLQISNGGLATVNGEFNMPHGQTDVRNSGSVLKVDRFTIGGDPTHAPATVHVEDGGTIQRAGGAESKITVNDYGGLYVQDSSGIFTGELLINGGTVNITRGGPNQASVVQVETGTQQGSLTITTGSLNAQAVFVRDGATMDVNSDGSVTSDSLSLTGQLNVSGGGKGVVTVKEMKISNPSTGPGGILRASKGGRTEIGSLLTIFSGVVDNTAGVMDIGVRGPSGEGINGYLWVNSGGWLRDDGAVLGNVQNEGGIISGTGTINGSLVSGGRIGSGNSSGGLMAQAGPGNPPGVLTVQGDYTQNSDGLLAIEIGGTDAGTGYYQLHVSGAASIAGNLQVRLVNGFTPTVGQTYRILNANSFSGAFSSIDGPSQAEISVSNDGSGVTVAITSVVAGAPLISSPTTVTATEGEAFSYQIAATNNPMSFGAMNLPNGLTVDHATGLISGTPTITGNYIVPMAANNDAGSGQADLIIHVGLPTVTTTSQLLNISTRMRVLTDEQVLIAGFIITGTDPKNVIIRGIGPSLNGVGVTLADPTLELHQGSTTLATNDNWKINDQTQQSQEAAIIATTIPPTNDLESAILMSLSPGTYTAILAGNNGGTGVGLVEVYDLAQGANSQLANISTRGFVDTDNNVMIGGFIVGGASARVIVRALGPSVPVENVLADPTLELHDASGTLLSTNDNWKINDQTGQSQQAEIEATTIPPTNDLESAVLANLPPGNYTAVVRGKNNTTGVGLVEVYGLQ